MQGGAALDRAGAEGRFPTGDYTEIFAEAKRRKIPFTVHAGEAGGAEDVILAVKAGASRIGHGVRAAQSEKAVKLLRDSGVTLEMCPTSNRLTGACDMKNYPLRFFAETGVGVTVNTDDPAIERTSIKREFEYASELCALDGSFRAELLKNAVRAAFCSDGIKGELLKKL